MPTPGAQNISSLRPGGTAADRRVVAAVSSTTAAPAVRTDGFALRRPVVWMHLQVTGTDAEVFFRLWVWSAMSERWGSVWEGGVAVGDRTVPLELPGAQRVYLQVTSVTGTPVTASAWLGEVIPA